MKKMSLLLMLLMLMLSANIYAKQNNQKPNNNNQNNRPNNNNHQQQQPNHKPHDHRDDYRRLSNNERITRIERLNAEHKKLSNNAKDKKRVNEIRNEIIRLLPNSLDDEVMKAARERNGIFERAVDNAVKKMKDKNLGYDVERKSIFNITIQFVS